MRDALEELGPGEPGPRVPVWMKVLPVLDEAPARRAGRQEHRVRPGRRAVACASTSTSPRHRRASAGPAILQIHGGGWVIGDKREQGIPLLGHLAANGWVGFNANYRLSPGATFPDHLVDCKRAMAWFREHADEHGGDPDFLCVTGGSAGGHLTALVALTANDPRYQPGFEDVDTTRAGRGAVLRRLRLHQPPRHLGPRTLADCSSSRG